MKATTIIIAVLGAIICALALLWLLAPQQTVSVEPSTTKAYYPIEGFEIHKVCVDGRLFILAKDPGNAWYSPPVQVFGNNGTVDGCWEKEK